MRIRITLLILISILIIYLLKSKYHYKIHNDLKIYASFTSIPGRLDKTEKTLKSLLNQSYPIEAIYINIPTGQHKRSGLDYYVPEYLYKYSDKVIVSRCPEYGPATKLLGSIPYINDPNAYIYIIDDDIDYKNDHLKSLVKQINDPKKIDVVINPLCWAAYVSKNGVCGYAGYLVKRKVLDGIYDFYNKIPKSCYTVDDMWVGAYLHGRTKKIKHAPVINSLWAFIKSNYLNKIYGDRTALNNTANKSKTGIFGQSVNDKVCRQELSNL